MLTLGDTIKGYKIVADINRGRYCTAFKVAKGGSEYFMKEYTKPTILSEDFDAFIDNQFAIKDKLDMVGDTTETIIEQFVYDRHYYQVKTLLPGENMSSWMEHCSDVEARFTAAIELTKIIQSIHRVHVVHQDLKPGQVMVVSEAPLKLVLTDFDWSIPDGNIIDKVGTYWYMPIDSTPSEKSDIFTLGIILCELLTGANPYQYNNDGLFDEKLWPRWVSGRQYTEPIELTPNDITTKLNKMILSCLSPEAAERPSIEEILTVLMNPGDIKRSITLETHGHRLILPAGATAGRRDFKLCFPDVTDPDENLIYGYISHDKTVLQVERDDEELTLCVPDEFSNKFILNGTVLTGTPVVVHDGDTLELFSNRRGESIATFAVTVK